MENTQDKIGRLLEGDEPRDAIHIAVAPVVAMETLLPGQRVKFGIDYDTLRVKAAPTFKAIGIIDPFLTRPVGVGERCYMFLLPNTVTGMRHEWAHPDFAANSAKARAIQWFKDREEEYGFDTEELLRSVEAGGPGAHATYGFGFGTTKGPEWAARPEFWAQLETATGRKFEKDHRKNTYFRCAC